MPFRTPHLAQFIALIDASYLEPLLTIFLCPWTWVCVMIGHPFWSGIERIGYDSNILRYGHCLTDEFFALLPQPYMMFGAKGSFWWRMRLLMRMRTCLTFVQTTFALTPNSFLKLNVHFTNHRLTQNSNLHRHVSWGRHHPSPNDCSNIGHSVSRRLHLRLSLEFCLAKYILIYPCISCRTISIYCIALQSCPCSLSCLSIFRIWTAVIFWYGRWSRFQQCT